MEMGLTCFLTNLVLETEKAPTVPREIIKAAAIAFCFILVCFEIFDTRVPKCATVRTYELTPTYRYRMHAQQRATYLSSPFGFKVRGSPA